MAIQGVKSAKSFVNIQEMKDFTIPLLPIKDLVLYPNLIICVLVGREDSIKAIEKALQLDSKICIFSQKDANIEDVTTNDLYEFGVMAEIVEYFMLPDQTYKVILKGLEVLKLKSLIKDELQGWLAFIEKVNLFVLLKDKKERKALQSLVIDEFEQYCKVKKIYDPELINYLKYLEDSFCLVYNIVSKIEMNVKEKQEFLMQFDEKKILETVIEHLTSDIEILSIKRKINNRVKSQIEKNQKEYYLNEQIKAIYKELGSDEEDELAKILEQINKKPLTPHAKETALLEYKKLKNMNQYSAETSIIKNYLTFLLELPWGVKTKTLNNFEKIKHSLDSSHYGMKEVKERIYELIVQYTKVKNEHRKSPILCFYGSPGIGKTSIAYAIGDALGIKTISIPLGGLKDESILRGHRKTYIGAMPGKIIQAIHDAQSLNLVIILDEIGSIGSDWRGNPEDVLLEILDPIQNKYFQDNYLGTGFDLSGIIFVATTNTINNLKPALLDRLEVIKLSGYSQEEKHEIAFNYIIPKLLTEYGLVSDNIEINKETMDEIIRFYTYESGVRGLTKQLSKIIRKVMCEIAEQAKDKKSKSSNITIHINNNNLKQYLKKPVYFDTYKNRQDQVGVVTGLGYVEGREGQEGELLTIESALVKGDGKIEFTGNLGDMMKESINIAHKLLISKANQYNIDQELFKNNNIYLNFPSGGIPKDGPSAGTAIFCSLFSLLKNTAFPSNVAMTGEISLYHVLKIGGVKEKLLAAYRHGIKKIFIPYDNEVDLQDLNEDILEKIEVIPVKTVDEILANLKLI